ncbi:hypothetical protein FIBSPDRAFT_867629 [Athelia psychrophila]|uniref:Uncharacterized protein n=1 Tax=Athelia psychrophila TaxID=1759441 RepID=A0A166DXH1_9AGAM|nr:hypothetical protein FIBSPDRAFT_867629 [Fibularhizoctonia sp. CBS 109695]
MFDRSHFLQSSSSKNLHKSDSNGPRTAPSCPSITHTGPFAFSTEFELQELARIRLGIPCR